MTALALLVGSNPLPNYLAARALDWEHAILFFTPQTEQVKERLVRLLQGEYQAREVTSQLIRDGTRARDVHSAWMPLNLSARTVSIYLMSDCARHQ
jgi:hypothetical protein